MPLVRHRPHPRTGTDIVTVAELLGHASLDSTRIFGRKLRMGLLGVIKSRPNLEVPVGFVHADPLPIGDQSGGVYHTDDGRQAVLPCDHRAMGHQASDLGH
jgi:hypothetical protein